MNAEDFGKDLGLIHEVVITGRKAGMDTLGYSLLAQSEEWFARIAKLCRHLAIMKRYEITVEPVDTEKSEKLINDVLTIIKADRKGCIGCGWSERRQVAFMFIPEEILREHVIILSKVESEEERKSLEWRHWFSYPGYFCQMLTNRLTEIGLHPAELAGFHEIFLYEDEYGDSQLRIHENSCAEADSLAKTIRQLVAQRLLLSRLKDT